MTGRPLRRSPLYTRLIEKHATFGNKFGERTVLFSHVYLKILMSPRQARDKHRESSTQKQTVFSGWERPTFFAESAEAAAAEPTYSWGAPYYFDAQESEHLHTREQVSVFDQTSFSKYLVQGKEALEAMQQLCAGDVDTELGKLTYTGTQPTPSIHLLSLSGPQLPHVCKTLF